jgi:hypothetical protein
MHVISEVIKLEDPGVDGRIIGSSGGGMWGYGLDGASSG